MYDFCPICDHWHSDKRGDKSCPPQWVCRIINEDDRWSKPIYEFDASDAAEKFAEYSNQSDPSLDDIEVQVAKYEEGIEPTDFETYIVTVEAVIEYTAHEKEPE